MALCVDLLQQSAVVDDPDPVRQTVHFRQNMTGHEDRDASVSRQVHQHLPDFDHARWIEAVGWFIEDQDLGLMQHGARQRQPLQASGRERSRLALGVPPKVQAFDRAAGCADIADSVEPAGYLQVLCHRQLGVGSGSLDEMPDPSPRPPPGRADGLTENADCAAARADHPQQGAYRRRLPGAVQAEEAIDLARLNAQVKGVDGDDFAIRLGQSCRFDRVLQHASFRLAEGCTPQAMSRKAPSVSMECLFINPGPTFRDSTFYAAQHAR